jgi:hypothetical protein
MMTRQLLAIALCLTLGACAGTDRSAPPAAASTAATPSRAAQLDALYEEWFEANLRVNPLQATQIGDPRYNDQLPNFLLGADWRAATERHEPRLAGARAGHWQCRTGGPGPAELRHLRQEREGFARSKARHSRIT